MRSSSKAFDSDTSSFTILPKSAIFAEILLQGPNNFILPAFDKHIKHRTNTTLAATKEQTAFRRLFCAEMLNHAVS
jgi:hypothetical protein